MLQMRDVNLELGGLLLDMAALAGDSQRAWGYKRAAKAVLAPRPPHHAARRSEHVQGRARDRPDDRSDRARVDLRRDVARSSRGRSARPARQDAIAKLRGFRQHFLSRAAVEEILARRGAPSRAKYRGDFQMHSVWSDGSETLESIVEACLARGYQCAGMTDHSYGLPIAGGMSMAQVVEQHAAIDELNAKYKGRFRMFKGIEANIRTDGTVDMEPHELRLFEFVVASPHSLLRKSIDQTPRMVGAVSQPGVCILGHPQGRRFNVRPGVAADWDQVFDGRREARRWRSRSTGRGIARTCTTSWPRARSSTAASSRSTATRTRIRSSISSTSRSPTRGSRGSRRTRIVNYWSEKRFLEWARGRLGSLTARDVRCLGLPDEAAGEVGRPRDQDSQDFF